MIKEIIHDVHFLSQKSTPATSADIQAVRDLKATFIANSDRAAGLAANMIGIHKRIIVFGLGKLPVMDDQSGNHCAGHPLPDNGRLLIA